MGGSRSPQILLPPRHGLPGKDTVCISAYPRLQPHPSRTTSDCRGPGLPSGPGGTKQKRCRLGQQEKMARAPGQGSQGTGSPGFLPQQQLGGEGRGDWFYPVPISHPVS